MVWPVQTHPAQSTGPESKRNSGDGGYFSLDFSFYRTVLLEPRASTGILKQVSPVQDRDKLDLN